MSNFLYFLTHPCRGRLLAKGLNTLPTGIPVLVAAGAALISLGVILLMLKQHPSFLSPSKIFRRYRIAIPALPCGTLLLALLLCRACEGLNTPVVLLLSCGLLILDLSAMYMWARLKKYSAVYHENRLLIQQNRAYREEFDRMRQWEWQNSALRHDIKNHLAVLREYAAQGQMDQLRRYLNLFDCRLSHPGYVHTGNPDVDSILNYKLGQAEKAGAFLELDVRLPAGFTADAFDLNVLLGNLLDNAVEGLAASVDKRLTLSLRAERGVLFLAVSNSYDGAADPVDRRAFRSCKGGKGHGLGLEIVRHVVDKYRGVLQIDTAGTAFTVEVILYLER